MANEQMRPASNKQAPDPSDVYERSHPDHEAGMGRLESNKFLPASERDKIHEAFSHGQDPTRQLNGEDLVDQRKSNTPGPQPDYSMLDEGSASWDAPPELPRAQKKHDSRSGAKGN